MNVVKVAICSMNTGHEVRRIKKSPMTTGSENFLHVKISVA